MAVMLMEPMVELESRMISLVLLFTMLVEGAVAQEILKGKVV